MLIVYCEMKIKPGKKQDYINGFKSCQKQILASPGNIEYFLCEDKNPKLDYSPNCVDLPKPRENMIIVIEKWKDMESYNNYLTSEIKKDFGKRVYDIIDTAIIRTMEYIC